MLAKILGIILIAVGGYFGLFVLFGLIGSLFTLLVVLIKLAIAAGVTFVGYRMVTRDRY
jgi:hypothetical protein